MNAGAILPPDHGRQALLMAWSDVWGMHYYIGVATLVPRFVGTFLDKLVSWSWTKPISG